MYYKTWQMIDFPVKSDYRGDITILEGQHCLPFEIKRIYYLHNLSTSADRAAHGHRRLQQIVVAISGSFDILLDDGLTTHTFHLDSPNSGLYIPPKTWRELSNLSENTVILILASESYDASDYVCDYDQFFTEFTNII
jgi:dTDP-4-dehydrorhamnose 3,5-epimerase-like enzyme